LKFQLNKNGANYFFETGLSACSGTVELQMAAEQTEASPFNVERAAQVRMSVDQDV